MMSPINFRTTGSTSHVTQATGSRWVEPLLNENIEAHQPPDAEITRSESSDSLHSFDSNSSTNAVANFVVRQDKSALATSTNPSDATKNHARHFLNSIGFFNKMKKQISFDETLNINHLNKPFNITKNSSLNQEIKSKSTYRTHQMQSYICTVNSKKVTIYSTPIQKNAAMGFLRIPPKISSEVESVARSLSKLPDYKLASIHTIKIIPEPYAPAGVEAAAKTFRRDASIEIYATRERKSQAEMDRILSHESGHAFDLYLKSEMDSSANKGHNVSNMDGFKNAWALDRASLDPTLPPYPSAYAHESYAELFAEFTMVYDISKRSPMLTQAFHDMTPHLYEWFERCVAAMPNNRQLQA